MSVRSGEINESTPMSCTLIEVGLDRYTVKLLFKISNVCMRIDTIYDLVFVQFILHKHLSLDADNKEILMIKFLFNV